jgi:uncharacterized phiE125 gp8 family phage protein
MGFSDCRLPTAHCRSRFHPEYFMNRILLEGPAVEPVLLAEAKAHLRLDGSAEDDLVGALIAAARVAVEMEIRRVLIEQRWRALVERWPSTGVILPVSPAIGVDEVRAIDRDGAATVLASEDYEFEAADGSVLLLEPVPEAVCYEIDFSAGYGSSGLDVPQPLRHAIRLLVTHWYEHRSAVIMGDAATAAPLGWRELVAPYRRMLLC